MDEIDRKIVSQLQLDGRTTLKELSRIVGYTSMGIKKRVRNLLEQDVIKVSALLNIEPLKLCAAILFLEIESAEAMHKLLERFRNCPRVVHIFTTLGGYNLIALIMAEDPETLQSISIEKCSLRSSEGIRRSEFYPIGNINYSPFLPIREHLTHKERTTTPCNVDCRPCNRYKAQKCVGCPATIYYRGTL
ncbi:MAG: winged helix-turn-helix transcriptional regulator [Candidatus Bathyarchaeota archaeon]|nr:winged helix-turn-helix transcriptional regulator [Candidatus Bathyarchaeota archaeon]MDH5662851.1 winged helix-turn-helix transcriptional regulator [Candidatus Bathyarchaeota archaeon]